MKYFYKILGFLLLLIMLFSCSTGQKKGELKMEKFELIKDSVFKTQGGLEVLYKGSGHKRTMTGGPSKSWHNFSLNVEGKKEDVVLYIKGTQGESFQDYEFGEQVWSNFLLKLSAEPNPPHGFKLFLNVSTIK